MPSLREYCKIQINEVDIEPSMTSSSYFSDFFQIGIVIEKKSEAIPNFMAYFFDQVYTKKNYVYQYVNIEKESSAFSRAFYLNNTEKHFQVYFGQNYDYTKPVSNDIE